MQAGFLFELALKATIVIGSTGTVVRLMRRASASARSSVWAAGLIFVLALPLCMIAMPLPSLDISAMAPVRHAMGTIVPDRGLDQPLVRREAIRPSSMVDATHVTFEGPISYVVRIAVVVIAAMSIIWLGGTLVALAWLGRGLLEVRRITNAAAPLEDPEWTALVEATRDLLGLRSAPAIRISSGIGVPAVSGLLNPTLLLPPDCHQWPATCRRAVVLHELAHLKRRDCLVQSLADCACALYWFHPLVHSAASHFRHEREQACDDVVIAAGISPTRYADHLLDLVRAGVSVLPAPAVAFGTPSRLNRRITAILDDDRRRIPPSAWAVATAGVASFAVVAILGGTRLYAQPAAGQVIGHGGGVVTRVITGDTRQRASDALAAALRDSSTDIRRVAATAIESIQASGDAPLQVERSCRANCVTWPDVADAVHFLNDLRCQWLGGPVCDTVNLLESDDAAIRYEAASRVWPRTSNGAAALSRALLDPDRGVRNMAAIRLDSVHAPVAVPNWIVLLGDTDPMLRERAAISLGVIGDSRAIDPLGQALRDPETAVRLQAAKALASIALGGDDANAAIAGGALQARTVYRKEDGVTLPEVVREVKPLYTPAAMQARIQGGVVMRAVVEADGSVKDVEVVESLDAEHGLDNEATTSLKQWQFKPGLWMGEPVPVLITVEMQFTLK